MDESPSNLNPSPQVRRYVQSNQICLITPELIAEVSGTTPANISRLQVLDLHLRGDDAERKGRIRKIENMILVPNLRQLNLSYNAIAKIEGLDRLRNLTELNLAENAIRKIENLGSLQLLERLNLSGNQIQRIPESISALQRLTHLRIARNELDVVRDLRHLEPLGNLTKLRIDENPFSQFEHTNAFAVFTIRSLTHLNGEEILQAQREEARNRFAMSNVSELRARLAEELHHLGQLKREVGRSPERKMALRHAAELQQQRQQQRDERQSGSSSPSPQRSSTPFAASNRAAQRQLDEAHRTLAHKLRQIETAEQHVEALQRQIAALTDTVEDGVYMAGQLPYRDMTATAEAAAAAAAAYFTPQAGPQAGPGARDGSRAEAEAGQFQPSDREPLRAGGRIVGEEELYRVSRELQPPPTQQQQQQPQSHASQRPNPHQQSRREQRTPTAPASMNGDRDGGGNLPYSFAGTPVGQLASRQVSELTDRVGVLGAKLLEADREKSRLEEQLRGARDTIAQQQQQIQQLLQQQGTSAVRDSRDLGPPRAGAGATTVGTAPDEEVQQELRRQLQEAQRTVEAAEREAATALEGQDRLRAELAAASAAAVHEEAVKEQLRAELQTVSRENERIRSEMLDLRAAIMDNEALVSQGILKKLGGGGGFSRGTGDAAAAEGGRGGLSGLGGLGSGSAMDEWRSHEARVEIAGQRADIEDLQRVNERLQQELEASIREITAANEATLRAQQEAEHLRSRVAYQQEYGRGSQQKAADWEAEVRRLTQQVAQAEEARRGAEDERVRTQAAADILEAEMRSLLAAQNATPSRRRYSTGGVLGSSFALYDGIEGGGGSAAQEEKSSHSGPRTSTSPSVLFEVVEGSDSEHPARGAGRGVGRGVASRDTQRGAQNLLNAARFSVSRLELAAAEVVAHVVLEEIDRHIPAPSADSGDRSTSAGAAELEDQALLHRLKLKEACIKAALRLVHSSTGMLREQREADERASAEVAAADASLRKSSRRAAGMLSGDDEEDSDLHSGGANVSISSSSSGGGDGGEEEHKAHSPVAGRSARRSRDKRQQRLSKRAGSRSRTLAASAAAGAGTGVLGHSPSSRLKVKIHPFHALGDSRFLSKLVAEAQAQVAAMEDADHVRQEVKQMEAVVRELERKAEATRAGISAKEAALAALKGHCDEAKKQAKDTLDELEILAKRLEAGRDDVSRAEGEQALAKRELALSRQGLQEALAMSEMEHNNLQAVRSRIAQLKQEQQQLEAQILQSKEACVKEEGKLRATKTMATDQLRLLQIDLNKIQSDFKAKQRAIEDLEHHRRSVDEENEIKQRELENKLLIASREYEEESRKLTNAKAEARVQRLEIEQLTSKRRQLEGEVGNAQEKLSAETARVEGEEAEARRRLEHLDRKLHEAEKKVRASREQAAALEGEQSLLRHSVEELRRQQADLDRASETRRRASEEELSRAQNQAQVSVRAARQAAADTEQKRAELEGLSAEMRVVERRCDDLRRSVREQEMLLDAGRDAVKSLDLDRERARKEGEAVRKEEEDLRHQSQLLRASLEHDTRALDDLRRRLSLLQEEESSMKESEGRLRAALGQSRKALEDSQAELDEAKAATERERRALADVRSRRGAVEGELHRLEEERRCVQERCGEEGMRRMEVEAALLRAREEAGRAQKELVVANSRLEEASRREADLRQAEAALRTSQEKLKLDLQSTKSDLSHEKAQADKARTEVHDLQGELRRSQEALRVLEQELQVGQVKLDTLKAQQQHVDSMRDEAAAEINRLREAAREEVRRTERMEQACGQAEQRLRMVREEVAETERSYEKARSLTSEEEAALQEQRRALRRTVEELVRVEGAVAQAHQQMYEERQRALVEIGQLGQAKQSAQAQMFLVSEAHRRMDRAGPEQPLGGSKSTAAGSTHHTQPILPQSSLRDFTTSTTATTAAASTSGGVNIPSFVHSANTAKAYSAVPTTATRGIPLAPVAAGGRGSGGRGAGWSGLEMEEGKRGASSVPVRASSYDFPAASATGVGAGADGVSSVAPSQQTAPLELGSLQREVEKLRQQSAAILSSSGSGSH